MYMYVEEGGPWTEARHALLFIVDGHHKLVRWRLVTHCAIDGYSRSVVFIKCSSNNRANTVYESFLQAVNKYGLPSRIRCDQGGENTPSWYREEVSPSRKLSP